MLTKRRLHALFPWALLAALVVLGFQYFTLRRDFALVCEETGPHNVAYARIQVPANQVDMLCNRHFEWPLFRSAFSN